MSEHAFDAYVVGALFDQDGPVFALGDGSVRFQGGQVVQAHEGAILCAEPHPSGSGVVTGGDDGRLIWSRRSGAVELCRLERKWIDAIATSAPSGLIAFAVGREVYVRDVADPGFARSFRHERTAADISFDSKGRRLAVATYGGVWLWYARIAEQKPQQLRWAGSHIGVVWSPDGRFVVSSMQEKELHGWRIADARDMQMGGYPTKIKSLAFLAEGALMASSGAHAAVIWPFSGAKGPMGKEAVEVGLDESSTVVKVAASPSRTRLAAGLTDGRVWTADLAGRGVRTVKAATGTTISALAAAPDGKWLAWGDEAGHAGVCEL